jgi:hypothetical protein
MGFLWMRRFFAIALAFSLLTGARAALAGPGIDEKTLLVDGAVSYSAYGSSAGTYFARGLTEYLVCQNLGLRFEGFAQFTDPGLAKELRVKFSGVALGLVVHPFSQSWFDPYALLNAGASFTTGDGVRVAPSLALAGGINFHVGRAFVHLQAGWHLADTLLLKAGPGVSDLRVQAGVGFAFDLALKARGR